jgi:ATP-dependent exoDNAse (exonuclease V) alpha subunit
VSNLAIFHCSIKIISRGKGQSAIASAAYRSGEPLDNEYDGKKRSYPHKRGIVYTEILLPNHAPLEYANRSALWNAVEKIEKQNNSQLAREVEVALPVELSLTQNIALVRAYVKRNFVNVGMCADVCVHDKDDGNPHAHIMLTMRPLNPDGSWGQKAHKENGNKIQNTDWNEHSKAELWREDWARCVNTFLEAKNSPERVDHRSYARQGTPQIPTIHIGPAATQMEREGIPTDKGNVNREIAVTNSQLRQLRARIVKLQSWLAAEKSTTPPSLAETLSAILENENRSAIANLKLAAKTLLFIQENHISDLGELADKVNAIHSSYSGVSEQIKKAERRVTTLDKHLEHSANVKKYRSVMGQYDKLTADADVAEKATGLFAKSKAEKTRAAAQDFYETDRAEITLYRAAEKYLKDVLQLRYDPQKLPPIMRWQNERETCKQELGGLYSQYHSLKSDVQDAETIKRFAEQLMRGDEQEQLSQERKAAKSKSRSDSR